MKLLTRCTVLLAMGATLACAQPRPAQAGSLVSGYLQNRPVLCEPVAIYYAVDVSDLTVCVAQNTWASMAAGMIAAVNANNAATATLATTATTALSANTVASGGPVPLWQKYSIVKIANAVGGCATAKGCWAVNGGAPVASAAATTQAIVWRAAPSNAVLELARWKTATACAGITAITLTDLGTTASASELFTGGTYDLKAVVSATNLLWPVLITPGLTAAATNWSITLSAGAENVDDITNGCAFDIEAKSSVLP